MAVWLESPSCVAIGEGPGYFDVLARLVSTGRAVGGLVHDARVAAICIHNGVSVLWTVDRDFGRFSPLKTSNPLVG
jgi:predicted nucleic acid-binding protein